MEKNKNISLSAPLNGNIVVDYQSISQINEAARYRSNVRTCEDYLKKIQKIQTEIGNLKQTIGELENERYKLHSDYSDQSYNDILNVLYLFGQAASNASRESVDAISFFYAFVLNLDPQACAETIYDYKNSSRLTKKEMEKREKKIKKEILQLESQINGLNAELRSYEEEITRMKKEMNGEKEYWEND